LKQASKLYRNKEWAVELSCGWRASPEEKLAIAASAKGTLTPIQNMNPVLFVSRFALQCFQILNPFLYIHLRII
jgi:hypothetical protein